MKFSAAGILGVLGLIVLAGGVWAGDTAKEGSPLSDPTRAALNEKAPDIFKAKFETSAGDFIIEVTSAWSPKGAERFYNLVNNGYYNECRFFRIIDNFMAQIGISGDPKLSAVWRRAQIDDDPVIRSNTRGFVSFATAGPNTRTTQFFINFKDNSFLDRSGFSPFGQVVEGMETVDELYSGYGEGAPRGQGPDQGRIQAEGNQYLKAEFTKLDYVIKATILPAEKTGK